MEKALVFFVLAPPLGLALGVGLGAVLAWLNIRALERG